MDSLQLYTICKNLFGPIFEGVYAKNQLPVRNKPNRAFIINTDTSNLPGQHWIAVVVKENKGYIFDSLCMLPPPLRLVYWMNQRYENWEYNKRQVQPIDSILCGVYCIHFLYYAIYTNHLLNVLFDNLYPPTSSINSYENSVKHFVNSVLD